MSIAAPPSLRRCRLWVASIAALAPLAAGAQEAGDAGAVHSAPAVFANGRPALDDPALPRQRGDDPGPVTVAATPEEPMRNDSAVTLWDEIAPPAPQPVPVDSGHAAQQSNVASDTRK